MRECEGCVPRSSGGPRLEEFSRGKWMAVERFEGFAPRDPWTAGWIRLHPDLQLNSRANGGAFH